MDNKRGWFELTKDKDLGYEGLIIGIFSIDWRKGDPDPDCYYPDIILELDQERTEGWWFISEMHITNPEIVDFADLALKVLEEIKGRDYSSVNEITAHLNKFLEDRIPENIGS